MNTLPTDHPLRQAEWIWPEYFMYLHNHFAQFRWDFEWDTPGDPGVLYITADKSYRLWINGEYVCRGPARGYQSHWPFDEVPLAGLLRAGHNWISVEGYQTGCSTFQYLHQAHAGLLMAPQDAGLRAVLAKGKRVMRRSPGHRRQTARYSLQIDFQEHLDLRLDDRSWITSATAPEGWSATTAPPAALKFESIPFSRAPYYGVEPRGIPLLNESSIATPSIPTTHATGQSLPGYEAAENISWHWISELEKTLPWAGAEGIESERTDTALTVTIPATGSGKFHALVIPAGAYEAGVIGVEVAAAGGGEILDFQMDQFFRDGQPHFLAPGEGCLAAMGNRLILRPGKNQHEFCHPMGFGAITLIARDLAGPLQVKLWIRRVGYPFTMRGGFQSSDENLNAIHAACRHTQQLCAFDAYMDTPWREQAQWWGDARVQARNTFYLDGDARLLARGIRSIAGQNVGGLTPGHAPTCSYWCVLPDFALTWILTLWDYYWQTEDLSLFAEQTARVEEVLAYFDTPEARHPTGLLRHDKRYWLFEDWSDLPKDEIPTFLNLTYLLTIRHLAKLHGINGNADQETRFNGIAARQESLIQKYLFDTARGVFHPTLNDQLDGQSEPSVHDHTLALMMDLYPEHQQQWMARFVLPYLREVAIAGAKPSAFWCTYVLEEAIRRGHAAEAIAFIGKRWKPFLSTGTTWEDFNWQESSGGSACHAWTSHPSFHFVNGIVGIVQQAAGWHEILFRPAFIAGMDRAEAMVPSPRGDIGASWRREGGRIHVALSLPAGVSAKIDLPGQRKLVTGGVHRFEVSAAG